MPTAPRHVICLSNEGYAASLEPRKVYLTIADEAAEKRGFVRIVDESGEDYMFPASRFAPIAVPLKAEALFARRATLGKQRTSKAAR